jgi:hypothetical protein
VVLHELGSDNQSRPVSVFQPETLNQPNTFHLMVNLIADRYQSRGVNFKQYPVISTFSVLYFAEHHALI